MNKSELKQQILEIEENLAQMESQLQDFPNLTDSEKSQLIRRMENLKQSFEKQINDLQRNFIQLNDSSFEPSAIEDLEDKLQKIVKVLKQRASEHYDVDYNKTIINNNDQNQQMLKQGEVLFEEGMELANNMLKNIRETNLMVVDIETEIYEQRMKIIRTKDNLKEARDMSKRTKQLVGYFSNQMAKDKFFKVMIVIIAVLLVGCIVMLYFYKDQIGMEKQIEKEELARAYKEFTIDQDGNIELNNEEINKQNLNLFQKVDRSQHQKELIKFQKEKNQDQNSNNQIQKNHIKNKKIKRSRKLISLKKTNKKIKRQQNNHEGFTKNDLKVLDYFQQYFSNDKEQISMI